MDQPADHIISGRLSFPSFTMDAARALNDKSKPQYKKAPEKVKPSYNLLVGQAQLNKLKKYLLDQFLPWVGERGKAGEEKNALDSVMLKKLTKIVEGLGVGDWEADTLPGFVTVVNEKTAELAPDAVASVKINGFLAQDIVQKAIVRDVSDLKLSEPDPITGYTPPIIPEQGTTRPIEETNFELYPGGNTATSINCYAYVTGKTPGITVTGGTAILVNTLADRFGGGSSEVDEDALFMELGDD